MNRTCSLLLAVASAALLCGRVVSPALAEEAAPRWKPTSEEIRGIAVLALQERETQTAGLHCFFGRSCYSPCVWPSFVSYRSCYRPAYFGIRYCAPPVYYAPPCYSYPVYSGYSYSAYYPTYYSGYYYPSYRYPAVYSYPVSYPSYPIYNTVNYAPAVVVPAPVYTGCYYW